MHFRALLNACVKLPSVSGQSFTLKDVFQSKQSITIGKQQKVPAGKAIVEFIFSQLSQEGFLSDESCFLLYPGYLPGRRNEIFEEFVPGLSYQFGSYCLKDNLVRWKAALNKSSARATGQYNKVTFETEFNSLCLNIKRKIRDRTVVVLDDFSTSGISFEAARNLLQKADIDRLVLCAVGKYTRPVPTYSFYDVQKNFDVFSEQDKITGLDYIQKKNPVTLNSASQALIHEYFLRLAKE